MAVAVQGFQAYFDVLILVLNIIGYGEYDISSLAPFILCGKKMRIRCGRHIAMLLGERGVIESPLLQNPVSDRSIAEPKEPELKSVAS